MKKSELIAKVKELIKNENLYVIAGDYKDHTSIRYKTCYSVAEEYGFDPSKSMGMPDGDNCPRTFDRWWNSE